MSVSHATLTDVRADTGTGDRDTDAVDLRDLTVKTLARLSGPGAPLRIVQAGHPALRDRARAWEDQLEPELLAELARAMVITMRAAPGVGLAAPQVGIPLRLVVLEDGPDSEGLEDETGADTGGDEDADAEPVGGPLRRTPVPLRVLLDPSYAPAGPGTVHYWEGCLSVSGWQSIVPRHRSVRWSARELGRDGRITEVQEEWTGWPARIIQHESDHLDGTLCHDLGVPRSFVQDRYAPHYADLSEAVRRLGLSGDITRLGPGQVELD